MAKTVTVTNPVTGQPAQVDQLDHTAQQIDDAILKTTYLTNPNLLDNWYFVNPVDQRGGYVVPPGKPYLSGVTEVGVTDKYYKATPFSTWYNITIDGTVYNVAASDVVRGYTGAGYGIDRWRIETGTVLVENGKIVLVSGSGYKQLVDVVVNGEATLSILTESGLFAITGTLDQSVSGWQIQKNFTGFWMGVQYNSKGLLDIRITTGADTAIIAAKLELGSQQTLAHQENGVWVLNEIPDYGEQLARCQRYFQLYSSEDRRPAKAVDCRPTMRTDPAQGTVVVNGTTYYYNSAEL